MIDKVIKMMNEYPFLRKRIETVATERNLSFRDAVIFLLNKV